MSTDPVLWIESYAHHLRMRAAGHTNRESGAALEAIADTLERNSEYFRGQDPEITPKKKYPNPASYYQSGRI